MATHDQPTTPALAPPRKPLDERQLAFIHALANDPRGNAAAAARVAGYAEKNAATQAHKMLTLAQYEHVRLAYQELVDARLARYNIDEDAIVRGLAAIALGDKRDVMSWTVNKYGEATPHLKPSEDLFPEQAAQIKGFVRTDNEHGTVLTPLFHSNLEAWIALAKIKGLMRERLEATVDVRISGAAERTADQLQILIQNIAQAGPGCPDIPGESPGG